MSTQYHTYCQSMSRRLFILSFLLERDILVFLLLFFNNSKHKKNSILTSEILKKWMNIEVSFMYRAGIPPPPDETPPI